MELCTLQGHTAEIVSLSFSTEGSQIVTGSFDYDAKARGHTSGQAATGCAACGTPRLSQNWSLVRKKSLR